MKTLITYPNKIFLGSKRPIILLELLLAISLLGLSVIPFIRYPLSHLKRETETLFKMELDCKIEEELANLKIALYHKKIPDTFIFSGKLHKELLYETTRINVAFPGLKDSKHSIERRIYFTPERHKKEQSKEHVFLEARVSYCDPQKPEDHPLAFGALKVVCTRKIP